jgi:competence protein ComEA
MDKFKCAVAGIVLSFASWAVWAEPVNINTATAEQLVTGLKGVGKSKADAIVKDREKNGLFKSADDLSRVKGVKSGIINKNRDNITVGTSAAVPAQPVAAPAAPAQPAVTPAVPPTSAPAVPAVK